MSRKVSEIELGVTKLVSFAQGIVKAASLFLMLMDFLMPIHFTDALF